MKKFVAALAVMSSLAAIGMATPSHAGSSLMMKDAPMIKHVGHYTHFDCHCHPWSYRIAYYKAVHYRAVYYKPVYVRSFYHWCRCYVPLKTNPYAPYPNTFVEGAHVYVPPTYYYSPYHYFSHVLVHRSYEVGPTPSDGTVLLP